MSFNAYDFNRVSLDILELIIEEQKELNEISTEVL